MARSGEDPGDPRHVSFAAERAEHFVRRACGTAAAVAGFFGSEARPAFPLPRSYSRVQPHFFKILRKLAEDVPSLAFLPGGTLECLLQRSENHSHCVRGVDFRDPGEFCHLPVEFRFVDALDFTARRFK
jgi:hypothetical protein